MPTPKPTAKQLREQQLDRQAAQLILYMSSRHLGRAKGVPAYALALAMDWNTRHLRFVISTAREQGAPLCGTPKTGYYIARTPDELQSASAWLEHRAMHSLRLLAQMRRVSLPALLGQLRLPT